MTLRTLTLLVVLLMVVSPAGCRRTALPEAADPAKARTVLCQALDAWKSGGTADSLRTGQSITVIDPQWQDGYRLAHYELAGDGTIRGCDWRCVVSLSVQDASGRRSSLHAVYTVSTSPALVVVRTDPES
jgi:hypothetical protein